MQEESTKQILFFYSQKHEDATKSEITIKTLSFKASNINQARNIYTTHVADDGDIQMVCSQIYWALGPGKMSLKNGIAVVLILSVIIEKIVYCKH